MTRQIARSRARCDNCEKVYLILDLDRTYACKACDGTVRAIDVTDSGQGEASDGEGHPEDAASLRHQANDALTRAYVWIGSVTWLYRLGALAYAVATAFAVLALARTDVPEGPGVLVVGLTSLLSILMLVGAIVILFQPFAWTLVIAVLATVIATVHIVGPDPLGVAALASAIWAAVAWGALVPTSRFSKLIAEHKDLYIMHHASATTRRSLKGRSAEERHERLLTAMHRAARRAWKVSTGAAALFALVAGFGTHAVLTSMRPGILSNAIASFEAAWNEGGLAPAVEYLPVTIREQQAARLAGVTTGHWGEQLPELPSGQLQRDKDRAWIDYQISGVTMKASWYLNGLEWELLQLDLPVPPLEPSIDLLLEAWEGGEPDAIAALFSEEGRATMLESIVVAARERSWESFPEVQATDISNYSGGSATVVLDLERGKVETQWHLRSDGTWGMHGLKLPRRRAKR